MSCPIDVQLIRETLEPEGLYYRQASHAKCGFRMKYPTTNLSFYIHPLRNEMQVFRDSDERYLHRWSGSSIEMIGWIRNFIQIEDDLVNSQSKYYVTTMEVVMENDTKELVEVLASHTHSFFNDGVEYENATEYALEALEEYLGEDVTEQYESHRKSDLALDEDGWEKVLNMFPEEAVQEALNLVIENIHAEEADEEYGTWHDDDEELE